MLKLKKLTKLEASYLIRNIALLVFGALSLAFGTAIFLTKLNIVSGGISGIAIIIQYFFGSKFIGGQSIDIIVFIGNWVLWILGFFFVSKEFATKTLVCTIVFPLALALFLRVDAFNKLAETICYYGVDDTSLIASDPTLVPIGNLLICGIFGGVFIGLGVALSFQGGGSSGGIDVIIAIITKATGFKESRVSFVLDASIIICGMFIIPSNILPSLNGIISACVTAVMIEYFYIGSQTSYQADIISEHNQEISNAVQNILGRGATLIKAYGGHHHQERDILRCVVNKSQYKQLRDIIAKIDPKAFITFTQTNSVFGEGFKANKPSSLKEIRRK